MNGVNGGPHKYRNTNLWYFISTCGKASTVHAQCCVVVVVIVVRIDIAVDVYNYRRLRRVLKK